MGLFGYNKKTFSKNTERFKQWLQSFLQSYHVANKPAETIGLLLRKLNFVKIDIHDAKSAKEIDNMIEGVFVDLDEAFASANEPKVDFLLQRLQTLIEHRRFNTVPDQEEWQLENARGEAMVQIQNTRKQLQALEQKREILLASMQNGEKTAEKQMTLKQIDEEIVAVENRQRTYVALYNRCLQAYREKENEFNKQLEESYSFAKRLAEKQGEAAKETPSSNEKEEDITLGLRSALEQRKKEILALGSALEQRQKEIKEKETHDI